jgi:hypothetical protein
VARYFDCVALPHPRGAALSRLRMKRPPTEAGPTSARHQSPAPRENPALGEIRAGSLGMRRGKRRDVNMRELDLEETQGPDHRAKRLSRLAWR